MGAEQQSDFEKAAVGLARYRVARELGTVAVDLEEKALTIRRNIASLGLEAIDAPDGYTISVHPIGHEDPMDCQSLYPEKGDSKARWIRAMPDGYPHEANIGKLWHGSSPIPVFNGKSIEKDEEDGNIWVYNEAGDFRVLYRNGIELSLEKRTDGAGD